MPTIYTTLRKAVLLAALWAGSSICPAITPQAILTVESGDPWTPPFGVERVGRPLEAVVEIIGGANPADSYAVAGYRDGQEVSRQAVKFLDEELSFLSDKTKGRYRFGRITLDDGPAEAVLWVKTGKQADWVEVAKAEVRPPGFEAEAEARANQPANPVDLGAILPPANWLVLAGGQKAKVEVAALSRTEAVTGATVLAWYESSPDQKAWVKLALEKNRKARVSLALEGSSRVLTQDTLHVAIMDGANREIWRKDIHAMLVPEPPKWPAFGAVETKLRYDAGIPAPGGRTIDYNEGWDTKFKDVVVLLPNGGRFVFWRGSCNIPFWAGRNNTGFCHEWAERALPGPWGEPLMDHELRFSRVEIVESTEARVHVRWRYRSVGEKDAVTGDYAMEDYYFYPDGFGTRVVTLTCIPEAAYELNEFISITPAGGHPLRILPANMLDFLWVSGGKVDFKFPFFRGDQTEAVAKAVAKAGGSMLKMPPLGSINLSVPGTEAPIYRVRIGQPGDLAVIQYNPGGWGPTWPGNFLPEMFGPQLARGAVVTPAYWGYHWPLSRLGGAGSSDRDRIDFSPAHNSFVTSGWTATELNPTPTPIRRERLWMRDGLGKLSLMRRDTFAWMIGMTDATDDELRLRAQSYREPPAIQVQGAELNADSYYAQDRRALCLTMSEAGRSLGITISPSHPCVDPVFEIEHAPRVLKSVLVGGKPLDPTRYEWDGHTLWLNLTFSQSSELRLEFATDLS